MRPFVASPGLSVALVLACTSPNPAYHASQGADGSSSTAGPGSTRTTGDPSATATDPTLTSSPTSTSPTSTTEGGETTEPTPTTSTSTTTTTTTTTTGPVMTSTVSSDTSDSSGPGKLDMPGEEECPVADFPDLAVTVEHSPPPNNCNAPFGPVMNAVYLASPDPNSRVFRQCANLGDCKANNPICVSPQTFTLHFKGPTAQVPSFDAFQCVNITYLGDGFAAANTCNTRAVRIARVTGPETQYPLIYVGASGVPDTAELPAPWPDIIDFSIYPNLTVACDLADVSVCGQQLGDFDLVGIFSEEQVFVPMDAAMPATVPIFDQNNLVVGHVPGMFANVRSYAREPDACEFTWSWLANDNN